MNIEKLVNAFEYLIIIYNVLNRPTFPHLLHVYTHKGVVHVALFWFINFYDTVKLMQLQKIITLNKQ